jgi:hypothetical protein
LTVTQVEKILADYLNNFPHLNTKQLTAELIVQADNLTNIAAENDKNKKPTAEDDLDWTFRDEFWETQALLNRALTLKNDYDGVPKRLGLDPENPAVVDIKLTSWQVLAVGRLVMADKWASSLRISLPCPVHLKEIPAETGLIALRFKICLWSVPCW